MQLTDAMSPAQPMALPEANGFVTHCNYHSQKSSASSGGDEVVAEDCFRGAIDLRTPQARPLKHTLRARHSAWVSHHPSRRGRECLGSRAVHADVRPYTASAVLRGEGLGAAFFMTGCDSKRNLTSNESWLQLMHPRACLWQVQFPSDAPSVSALIPPMCAWSGASTCGSLPSLWLRCGS